MRLFSEIVIKWGFSFGFIESISSYRFIHWELVASICLFLHIWIMNQNFYESKPVKCKNSLFFHLRNFILSENYLRNSNQNHRDSDKIEVKVITHFSIIHIYFIILFKTVFILHWINIFYQLIDFIWKFIPGVEDFTMKSLFLHCLSSLLYVTERKSIKISWTSNGAHNLKDVRWKKHFDALLSTSLTTINRLTRKKNFYVFTSFYLSAFSLPKIIFNVRKINLWNKLFFHQRIHPRGIISAADTNIQATDRMFS